MSWVPVCSHGMTEAECQAAFEAIHAKRLDAWRAEQRAAGVPLALIEIAAAIAVRVQAEQLAHDLPLMMRDMQLSAPGSTTTVQ